MENDLLGDNNNNNNNNNSLNTSSHHQESDQSDVSLDNEYATDFAAQLKKKRKQVLDKQGTSNQNFANTLRKHRETLVGTWGESHQSATTMNGNIEDHGTNDNSDVQDNEIGTDDFDGTFNDETTPDLMTETADFKEKVLDSVKPEQSEPETDPPINTSVDSDDNFFGDFEARSDNFTEDAAPISSADQQEEKSTPIRTFNDHNGEDDDDFFGSFDTAPPTNDNDDNGKNEVSDNKMEEIETVPSSESETVELSLSQTGQVPAAAAPPSETGASNTFSTPPDVDDEAERDDAFAKTDVFGDFDEAPVSLHSSEDPTGKKQIAHGLPEDSDEMHLSQNGMCPAENSLHTNPLERDIEAPETLDIAATPQSQTGLDPEDQSGDFALNTTPSDGLSGEVDEPEKGNSDALAPQIQQQANVQDSDLDHLNRAPSQPEKLDEHDFQVKKPSTQDDDFGEFDGADSLNPEAETFDSGDGVLASPLGHSSGDDEDEAFGDFDAAPVHAEGDEKGLGAFDAAKSNPSLSTEPVERDSTQQASDEMGGKDDGFGDFGGCFDGAKENQNVEIPSAETPQPSSETLDEDFGDFDGPSAQSPQQSQEEHDNEFGSFDGPASHPQEQISEEADDGLGDFGGPATASRSKDVEEAEDDFGAFDGPATASLPNSVEDADDDFGDFDGPFATSPQQSSEPVDDDFGYFDTAPGAQPQTNETADDDGDDDDFGDFDTAPEKLAPQSVVNGEAEHGEKASDMEDFGRFDDMAIESVTPLAPVGEIGDKARNFFVRIQSKYAFPDTVEDDAESLIIQDSVSAIMESLPDALGVVKSTDSTSHEELFAALKGIPPREGKPNLIIDGDGWSPAQPFAYPVGGFHAPEKEHEMRQIRRSSIASRRVPDLLPIQLPTGTVETPLDTASPVAARRGKVKSSSLDTPPLPALGQSTSTKEIDTAVDKVTALLSKIPDLSFMLESTLVLPKK